MNDNTLPGLAILAEWMRESAPSRQYQKIIDQETDWLARALGRMPQAASVDQVKWVMSGCLSVLVDRVLEQKNRDEAGLVSGTQSPPGAAMRLLCGAQLQAIYGISYSDVHRRRLERSGKFPRRVRISANRVAYLESEIQAWIGDRASTGR